MDKLENQIPHSREVRLTGLLDGLKATHRTLELRVDHGSTVKCHFQKRHHATVKELWDRRVTITGRASFKLSKQVRHVEIRSIREAEPKDDIWSQTPSAGGPERPEAREVRVDRNGLEAIIGQWPGDESDEEIDAHLEDIS